MTDRHGIFSGMKMNFSDIWAKLAPARPEPGNDIQSKDFGILDHFEKIIEISRKYGIEKCLSKGKRHFDYTARQLGISPVEG